jgi:hypothetical protein
MAERKEGHFKKRKTGSEHRWTKYASKGSTKVLARSSEGYKNLSELHANAKKFGWKGNWNKCESDDWKVWKSSKDSKWYWTRDDGENGKTVGASHQGFASRSAAKENAEINGMT